MTPTPNELSDLYARHPLREETILARIERQRGTLDGITEFDLAHDSLTEITDQNHVGGLTAVVQQALRAGVGPADRVLDLGAGLGGSARCLAALFGCNVHCVELTTIRCGEGKRLTTRVGLDRFVTWTEGDAASVDLPRRGFEVVWGQGAWSHIPDKHELFRRAAEALVPGGRVAFEDGCLNRPARSAEAGTLAALERIWAGPFLSRDEWKAAVTGAGFEIELVDDLTAAFITHFERLSAIARTHGAGLYPEHEVQAFEHAITLAKAGVIGCSRTVARLPPL